MTGDTERLQVAVSVGTALSFGDDMVDVLAFLHDPFLQTRLTKVTIPPENALSNLGP